jgi:hypothetical protein
MIDAGLFAGQRYELIDGDLIDKRGQKPPHAYAIRMLHSLLAEIFGGNRVQDQSPIEVDIADRERTLPEPDLAVLAEDNLVYGNRFPRGDELLLAVEVSDTTLRHAVTTKRDLYARAAVCEYWILDIRGRRLIVCRTPEAGVYSNVQTFSENESVSVACRPEALLSVAAMLPFSDH